MNIPVRSLLTALDISAWTLYRPLRWLIPLALLNGLLFLVIAPPWQHYDEPGHFEYVWMIANYGHVPTPTEGDVDFRREVTDSMYRFRFFPPEMRPDLFVPTPLPIGAEQRVHPPLYYMVAAVPLRFAIGLPVEEQLYLVRAFSLVISVLTIVAAWRFTTVVVPDEPRIQRTIPLLLLFTPPFADIMTAVNNDVLANFAAVVVLLGCVMLIRDGIQPTPWILATLALGVGLGSKRTLVILILPYLLALFWAWRRQPLNLGVILGTLLTVSLTSIVLGMELSQTVDGATILSVRPWLNQIDQHYLRMNLNQWIASVTNLNVPEGTYSFALSVAFKSFWSYLSWGDVTIFPGIEWFMAGMCVACGVGLIIHGVRLHADLPVWQKRSIWFFLIAIVIAWLSLIARLHPLPSGGMRLYAPRGRYIFTMMLPTLWLLALGWQGLFPDRWKANSPMILVAIWLIFDMASWSVSLVNHFYRPIL